MLLRLCKDSTDGELVGGKFEAIGTLTIFGNPYIGAVYYLPESPMFFEMGSRIPVVPDKKGIASLTGNIISVKPNCGFDIKMLNYCNSISITARANWMLFQYFNLRPLI